MIANLVSHYEVLRKLGAGGMGEVFLAQDPRLGRKVALKLLPASYQYDPVRRERFLREARAASSLRSPNVAAIYDIGEHDRMMFIAMEYVEGELLSSRIDRGPLNIYQAIDIAVQVAEALDEAHSLQIVHRDIKSSNIILAPRGLVKVLDFGLAKVLSSPDQAEDRTAKLGKETAPGGDPRHGGLHVARAGSRARSRRPERPVQPGRSALRDAHRQAAAQGRHDRRSHGRHTCKEPRPLAEHSADIPAGMQWIVSKAQRQDKSPMDMALRLDPLSLPVNGSAGFLFYNAKRYDEAIARLRKALELDPDFQLGHQLLAACLERAARPDEAVTEYLKMFARGTGEIRIESMLADAYAQSGMPGFWRRFAEYAPELASRRLITSVFAASIFAYLEERDEAFRWLERAFGEQAPALSHIKADPRFENLRSDPRFAELLRRTGLNG